MAEYTREDLKALQSETLEQKFQRTLGKVGEWYNYWDGNVYVAFSGGKDSTVLADICARWCALVGRTLYLVFVNTGLEYPEIQKHVKFFAEWLREKYSIDVQLEIVRPKMRFDEVIKTYGYPIIGKRQANAISLARKNMENGEYTFRLRSLGITAEQAEKSGLKMPPEEMLERYERSAHRSKFNIYNYRPLLNADFRVSDLCCNVMKKAPAAAYERRTGRKPILATMAAESAIRENAWLANGCNAFNAKHKTSQPMSFWTEQDVLRYIKERGIPIASVYGAVEYAVDPEQMRWEEIDPEMSCFSTEEQKQLTTTGCSRTGCIFCAFGCHLEKGRSRFETLKETHPRQYAYCIGGGEYDEDGIWKPNKDGLGMGHVFDELNKIYGDGFIKY